MVEGTRAKQMESRLDAIEFGMRQNQEQVEDHLEMLDLGIRNT